MGVQSVPGRTLVVIGLLCCALVVFRWAHTHCSRWSVFAICCLSNLTSSTGLSFLPITRVNYCNAMMANFLWSDLTSLGGHGYDHSRVVSWRINCRCVPLVRGVVEVCCHVTQAARKHPVSCQVMSIPWMPKLATCWQTLELLGFLTREIAFQWSSETLSLAIWFVPVL